MTFVRETFLKGKRRTERERRRRKRFPNGDNSLRSTCNDSRLSRADLVVVDLLEPINYLGSARGGGGEGSVARVEKGGGGGGWDTGGKRHLE